MPISKPRSRTQRGVKCQGQDIRHGRVSLSRLISRTRMEAVKEDQHQCQSQDAKPGEVPTSKPRSMTRRSVNVEAGIQDK